MATVERTGYFSLDTEGHRITWNPKAPVSRQWSHEDAEDATHDITPELRFAIDATCPGCGYPEIGFAPDRGVFTCSNCRHEQTPRPKD